MEQGQGAELMAAATFPTVSSSSLLPLQLLPALPEVGQGQAHFPVLLPWIDPYKTGVNRTIASSANTAFAELLNFLDCHRDLRSQNIRVYIKGLLELQTQHCAVDNISAGTHHRMLHGTTGSHLGDKLQSWLIKPDNAAFQLWEGPMINPPLTSAWVERYNFHQSKFKNLETVDGPN